MHALNTHCVPTSILDFFLRCVCIYVALWLVLLCVCLRKVREHFFCLKIFHSKIYIRNVEKLSRVIKSTVMLENKYKEMLT